ncbi:hypothetical protein [Mycobacteroides abscessus]|uniref:hypothetical protein n=1 Tax=Mycobacteroides abscessus TaxID=36809 RepID=UPI0009C82A7C|nr:hypothetical protein [Mycobacteroides abscessus]SLJ76324.1 Uncharacterised protein [Mycobacteroides abscessus subsp. abscessus]SLJ80688.1 Uncharacterised protein [Mycobacteroides abscessus subsp. abscessus]
MSYNRPYIFELAHQLLADRHAGNSVEGHYANAERNGISRAVLDRAANTLQRIAPEDFVTWIRQEYLVDGWLHGYVDVTSASTGDELTTWVLGQLADAHYQTHDNGPTPNL